MNDDDYPISRRQLAYAIGGSFTIGTLADAILAGEEAKDNLKNADHQHPDGVDPTPTEEPTATPTERRDGGVGGGAGGKGDSGFGPNVQTFDYEGKTAISAGEFGGEDALLREYGGDAGLNEMLEEHNNVFVREDDRVYASGGEVWTKVPGVYQDAKDGELDGE